MSPVVGPRPLREPGAAALARLLAESGVDTSTWGIGEAKTLGHLLVELREGDCDLYRDDVGLARRVRNVWVDVRALVGDVRHLLVERRQVFDDGRTRERSLPASLGEKCKVGEDPRAAARRGIAEELGLESGFALSAGEPRDNPIDKPSFPGLRTVYETHWFVAELDSAAYRADGYVEIQADKRTYFEWVS